MKFKTIFILFNVFIILSFLLISLVPLFVLGVEYSALFWSKNWIITVLFVVFIGALDGYFIYNWKLFSLLEKEDWPLLISYLEDEIYRKKKFTKRNVSLLINAYLSVSNLDKVKRLETEIRSSAPGLLPQFALYLGTPYLLENDLESCARFYEEFILTPKARFLEWIRWCHAFALVSLKKVEESKEAFVALLKNSKDEILLLLTLYLLQNMDHLMDDEDKNVMSERKEHLRIRLSDKKTWERIFQKKTEENLLILLLSSLIRDALNWLTSAEKAS